MENILNIKNEVEQIKKSIKDMVYGSVEIRNNDNKKYIYVHYRESGVLINKYVGEYSEELYNLILNNNKRVKELKKRLKDRIKEIDKYGDVDSEVTDAIKLNIDLARKNLVDSIYKQSILEGVATTYADTENLINEGLIHNMSTIDVTKIINLKHAWEFIMNYDVESYPTNYVLLCQINKLVEENLSFTAGRIRSVSVRIGGTKYLPPMPFESSLKEQIDLIINDEKDQITKAATLIAFIMKAQPFIDGNKRTAIIFGNHYLISHGLGLIVVPIEKLDEYKKLLIEYYESKNNKLINFLKRDCYIKLK